MQTVSGKNPHFAILQSGGGRPQKLIDDIHT